MRVLLGLGVIWVSVTFHAPALEAETSPSPTPTGLVTPAATASSSPARHLVDGRDWWLALSRNDKLRVVEGAMDGFTNGWWRAFTEYDTKVEVIMIKSYAKTKDTKVWFAVAQQLGHLHEEGVRAEPHFSKKFGFYIDGIDHFYASYPHATNVTFGEILQCLSDKPWKSCAEVANMFSR